jgi:hypothetical protein
VRLCSQLFDFACFGHIARERQKSQNGFELISLFARFGKPGFDGNIVTAH